MDADGLETALIDQVTAVLADGPCPLDALTELLAEGGYLDHWPADDFADLVDQLDVLLDRYEGFWVTPGDIVAFDVDLMADTVFTHRVDADELAREMLDASPDLTAFDSDTTEPLPLSRGGAIELVFPFTDQGADDHGSFAGPPGWLATFAPGDLLAVHRRESGVYIEAVDEVGDGALEVEALHRAFAARVLGPEVGEAPFVLVLDVIAEQPAAFAAPVRPLGALLHDAGLECEGDWVGPIGVDWKPPAIATAEAERVLLAERYQLDVCCLELLDEVMAAWNELTVPSGGGDIDWRDVARWLNHGYVAPAFADHVLRELDELHPVLSEFVDALRVAGSKGVAPASYLAARNLERAGDVRAAETSLQAAVRADPAFDPAIEELAWYVADRGDADQAINLLRRIGAAADDPELRLLESMRPPRNAAGRNDPCPCGSGRKYKDCCLRNSTVSLGQRSDWLLHKLWTFTLRPHRQRHVLGLALVLSSEDEDLDGLLDSGLPMDLAAFDDDLALSFLAERGPLLPDDERALLESWVLEPRTLWVVLEHQPGQTLGLRSTESGRVVAVARSPGSPLEPGSLLYARVGVVDDHHRFVGVPLDVAESDRSSVEAVIRSRPNAWDIARWFAQLSTQRS